jgi:Lipid A 3-O-deacylase (PagL)
MELGGGLLLRYRLERPGLRPYAEVNGGMLYADLRGYRLGSRVLFTVGLAVGVEIPLGDRLAATAGYRFRHISYGGQTRDNPGLDSNLVLMGLAYTY